MALCKESLGLSRGVGGLKASTAGRKTRRDALKQRIAPPTDLYETQTHSGKTVKDNIE